ncbi:O-antigen ligase family protein [Oceanibaculum indicum]|uniref:O-antigen ligase-related domain-containing protein n=1 Tax=Oceanibaculum indicum P24 TaxID=1207063 RepID=K2KI62_9PROT|nr:O-antigen ligase family protein [Oceanibaculum indicum]EKE76965.1 hypothetical protein P24_07171 [Oceanibaculum indicum P24]
MTTPHRFSPDACLTWTLRLLALWILAMGALLPWAPRALQIGLFAAALLTIVLHWVGQRHFPWPRYRLALPVALFFAYAGLTAAWSVNREDAASQLVQFALVFGVSLPFFAALLALPETALRPAAKAVLIGLALGVALFLVELFADQPIYRLTRGMDFAEVIGANAINRPAAVSALLIWPLAYGVWRLGWRKIALALPVLFAVAAGFSSSQSALGGMLAGLLFWPLAAISLRGARRLLRLVVAIAFLAMPFLAQALFASGLGSMPWLPFSMGHRVAIWHHVAGLSLERPFFGWGLEASRVLSDFADMKAGPVQGTIELLPLHPHNAPLQIWLELGGVGALLALAMAWMLLHTIGKLDRAAQLFAYPLFACGLFMSGTAYGAWQTWWISGFLTAAACFLILWRGGSDEG